MVLHTLSGKAIDEKKLDKHGISHRVVPAIHSPGSHSTDRHSPDSYSPDSVIFGDSCRPVLCVNDDRGECYIEYESSSPELKTYEVKTGIRNHRETSISKLRKDCKFGHDAAEDPKPALENVFILLGRLLMSVCASKFTFRNLEKIEFVLQSHRFNDNIYIVIEQTRGDLFLTRMHVSFWQYFLFRWDRQMDDSEPWFYHYHKVGHGEFDPLKFLQTNIFQGELTANVTYKSRGKKHITLFPSCTLYFRHNVPHEFDDLSPTSFRSLRCPGRNCARRSSWRPR